MQSGDRALGVTQAARIAPRLGGPLAVFAVGGIAFAIYCYVGAKASFYGINTDAAIYLLLADVYSPWHAAPVAFVEHLYDRYPFAPLYPIVLGLLGGGAAAPYASFVAGAALAAVGLSIACAWMRAAGLTTRDALLATILTALTPALLLASIAVYSEHLYLTLFFAGLLAGERAGSSATRWYLAAALFGLTAATRSVGVVAVLAFMACWTYHTRLQRFRLAPVIAAIPFLAWYVVRQVNGWHADYSDDLMQSVSADALRQFVDQALINFEALGYHWVRRFDLLGGQHVVVALVPLTLLLLIGLLDRLRTLRTDAVYVLLYLMLLLVWPYPNHMGRFLVVLLPLALFYLIVGIGALRRRYTRLPAGSVLPLVTLVVVALLIGPSSTFILAQVTEHHGTALADHARMPGWYHRDTRAASVADTTLEINTIEHLAALQGELPLDACVTSTKAELVMLHTRRRAERPAAPDSADFRRRLAACPWVVMTRGVSFPSQSGSYYPLRIIHAELELVAALPRVDGDSAGRANILLGRYRPASAGHAIQ